MDLKGLIEVARGDAQADLVLTNARIVNTFTGEIEENSVAVHRGRVAGVGDYTWARTSRGPGRQIPCAGIHRRARPPGEHVPPRRPVRQGCRAQRHAGSGDGPPRGDQRVGPGRYALHHGLRPQRCPWTSSSWPRPAFPPPTWRHPAQRWARRTSRRPFDGEVSWAWERS